ncbi:unnamed protein product [Thelazia callipaeda]|uniref:C2H2-type domain-containing protein n=1 Tax=Thelazia callipaeda TaxID=103827 RepID=A0A0N5CJ99_THECL|nr:unnamed protein product [Thelazia callipaeda]
MDSESDLKPIVPLAAAAAAGSLMLSNCEQNPLGKLMEQYNRLASESRIITSNEKLSKKDSRSTESIAAAAAAAAAGATFVDTIPYTNAAVYPPYSWTAATSTPWWTADPAGTWPSLPYSSAVGTENASTSYSPYLGPQFQGLLSAATVPVTAVVGSSSGTSNQVSISNYNSNSTKSLSKILGNGNSTTHAGGGKLPARSNCECPNCQEAERLGELLNLHIFYFSEKLIQKKFFTVKCKNYTKVA